MKEYTHTHPPDRLDEVLLALETATHPGDRAHLLTAALRGVERLLERTAVAVTVIRRAAKP